MHFACLKCLNCAFWHAATLTWPCAGNYAKELEEDYTVYDAISEVQGILGANEVKCNALKAQYSKYGYLWKRDLNETLKVALSLPPRPVKTCNHCVMLRLSLPYPCLVPQSAIPVSLLQVPCCAQLQHLEVPCSSGMCSQM